MRKTLSLSAVPGKVAVSRVEDNALVLPDRRPRPVFVALARYPGPRVGSERTSRSTRTGSEAFRNKEERMKRFAGIDIGSERHVVAVVDEHLAVLVKPTPFGEKPSAISGW